jgi:hypothetical protein
MLHEIGFPKRFYYYYLGTLYQFTYYTTTHKLLGFRYSLLFKLLAIMFVLAAWVFDWGQVPLIILIALLVWIYLAFWRARKSGYYKFIGGKPAQPDGQDYQKLPPYEPIPCLATGFFSVQDWEKRVLLKPADYWQVPHGDHALMVEHLPHKYLYQFFNVAGIKDFQHGWLLHGSHPKPALSISFLSIWGPEFAKELFSIFRSEPKPVQPIVRTIYLSFSSDEEEELIFQNILRDIQQFSRKEKTAESAD